MYKSIKYSFNDFFLFLKTLSSLKTYLITDYFIFLIKKLSDTTKRKLIVF